MSEVSFTPVAPPAPVQPGPPAAAAAPAAPAQPRAAPGPVGGPQPAAGRQPGATENPNEFKIKTDLRSAHSFTYTFFDTKTLELIGQWPAAPAYQIAAKRIAPGSALEAIA